jgi:hypothetical protein
MQLESGKISLRRTMRRKYHIVLKESLIILINYINIIINTTVTLQ